jgi:hypothetical protein
VLEACKGEKDLRLTLIKPAKEEDEPDTKRVSLPGLPIDAEARVLAVIGTTTAVYLPVPRPVVVVYDDTGTKLSETPAPATPVFGAVPAVTRAGDMLTWWTGRSLMVFDSKLAYRYTVDGDGPLAPVGPAAMMAGRLLVPVAEGLAVYATADGVRERVIPLAHPAGTGPVRPAVAGETVIEQRDATVAAYGLDAGGAGKGLDAGGAGKGP